MEPQVPPVVTTTTVSSSRGIFGTKIPSTAAFIAAILVFLLPFAEVKCGNATLANQTGVGFAIGNEWKAQGMFDQKDVQKTNKKDSPGNSQIIIIGVIVLALMGFLLSIAN